MKRAVPVLITLSSEGLFYYYYFTIFSSKPGTGFDYTLCLFHIFFFLNLLSLFLILLCDSGKVPKSFEISEIPEYEKQESPDNIIPKYFLLGRAGYCVKCHRDRPHRAHHCSICGVCIMRYDHHCIFLGSCIGLKSVKLFILYLFYSFLSTLVTFIDCTSFLLDSDYSTQILLFCILSGILALFFLTFCIIHFSNVCLNVTAVEFKWQVKEMFDCGVVNNIKQVFGETYLLWLVPIESSEINGLKFPMKIRRKGNEGFEVISKYLI